MACLSKKCLKCTKSFACVNAWIVVGVGVGDSDSRMDHTDMDGSKMVSELASEMASKFWNEIILKAQYTSVVHSKIPIQKYLSFNHIKLLLIRKHSLQMYYLNASSLNFIIGFFN